jgi:molybdopterin/thiamine biosynthesis adenylyltransferase
MLLMRNVPYLTTGHVVRHDGQLVSELTMSGDLVAAPNKHDLHFVGSVPFNARGTRYDNIIAGEGSYQLAGGMVASFHLSAKPSRPYPTYYEKMTTYANLLTGAARTVEPRATAQRHLPVEPDDESSVFKYLDTFSGGAVVSGIARKLELDKVAVIGLGGTGSYLLDLVAKTPVKQIHLFDGDLFYDHNAFRTPGAASIDELCAQPTKVAYLEAHYSKMRYGIVAHPYNISVSNLTELQGMDFVFICIDGQAVKRQIINYLEDQGASFIDVGMDVYVSEDALGGVVRVTTSTPDKREHVYQRLALSEADEDNYRNVCQGTSQPACSRTPKLHGDGHQFCTGEGVT